MTNFEWAKQIADAASFMDDLKEGYLPWRKAIATHHIEILHDIAEQLAGNRVNEIYQPEEQVRLVWQIERRLHDCNSTCCEHGNED